MEYGGRAKQQQQHSHVETITIYSKNLPAAMFNSLSFFIDVPQKDVALFFFHFVAVVVATGGIYHSSSLSLRTLSTHSSPKSGRCMAHDQVDRAAVSHPTRFSP